METETIQTTLEWLWRASWQAGVLVVVVLLVQQLLRNRLAPRWRYALWLLVVGRLLLPVSLESGFSIFNLASSHPIVAPSVQAETQGIPVARIEAGSGNAETKNAAPSPLQPLADESAFVPQSAEVVSLEAAAQNAGHFEASADTELLAVLTEGAPRESVVAATQTEISWKTILFGIWLMGTGVCVFRLLWGNIRFARELRRRTAVETGPLLSLFDECARQMNVRKRVVLVETPDVDSPALFGCFRLRLLLPERMVEKFSTRELRYIFRHELAHIRRGDVLVNWLMALLQALHWFNPLVWVAFHRMRVDRELACDALALSFAAEEESKSYGETIIKLLESFTRSNTVPGLVGILEDKQQMKERLTLIANFKRASRWQLLALFLVVALGAVTLTDAQTRKSAKAEATSKTASGAPQVSETLTNSLGMRFVPVGDLLVSVWETRVKDFAAFVDDTAYDATADVFSHSASSSSRLGKNWRDPGFPKAMCIP